MIGIAICSFLILLSIIVPIGLYFLNGKKNAKRTLIVNLISFFSILLISTIFIFSGNVSAATTAATGDKGLLYLAAALVTGFATIGAGIAVAGAASAAIGAVSENEKLMGRALIFVALAEGIPVYGLLVTFVLLGQG